MNFWWVNHSQTFRHEFFGKYIWSPKRKRNDRLNPFYETMREVAPGDIVYSFADGAVQGFGMARTHCYTLGTRACSQERGSAAKPDSQSPQSREILILPPLRGLRFLDG